MSLQPGRGWASSSQPMDEFSPYAGAGKAGSEAEFFHPSLHSASKSCYCHYKIQFAGDAKMPVEQTGQIYHAECIYSKSFCIFSFKLLKSRVK